MATMEIRRIPCLLAVGVQHVFESHPLRVEIQVDVPGAPISVLPDEQLRRAFDLAAAVIHVLAEERQDDVGVVFHGSERAEIVEGGTAIVPRGEVGQLGDDEYGGMLRERQRFQASHRVRELFVQAPLPRREILQRIDDDEIRVAPVQLIGEGGNAPGREGLQLRKHVAETHRRRAGGRARLLARDPLAQLIDANAPFDGQRALQEPLRGHFARVEGHRGVVFSRAHRQRQRERGLAATNVSAERDEIAAPQTAAQHAIQARKARWQGVWRSRAVRDGINAGENLGERRDVSTPGHGPKIGPVSGPQQERRALFLNGLRELSKLQTCGRIEVVCRDHHHRVERRGQFATVVRPRPLGQRREGSFHRRWNRRRGEPIGDFPGARAALIHGEQLAAIHARGVDDHSRDEQARKHDLALTAERGATGQARERGKWKCRRLERVRRSWRVGVHGHPANLTRAFACRQRVIFAV
jgi:hypothetical protein